MRVDIEYIRYLQAERIEFNALPLEEIEFYEGNRKLDIDPKVLEDFGFTGLMNIDFVMSGFYDGGFDQWDK